MRDIKKDVTAVITSSEDMSVFRCIESVKDQAQVVVSMTPYQPIEDKLSRMGIPFVVVPRGNLGLTYNQGIKLAATEKVLITTDDTVVDDGAVEKLSAGLDEFDACKARLIFDYDPSNLLQKAVADVRDLTNSSPTRAFTPGLAFNKRIAEQMGGHFFNEDVKWAEDSEFSFRLHKNNLRFGYIDDAVIHHAEVDPIHDLKGAFLIGLSKRRAVDLGLRQGDEDLMPTLQRVLSGETFRRKYQVMDQKGLIALMYKFLWDGSYNAGYNLRKAGLSDLIEDKLWNGFGRGRNSSMKEGQS